MALSLDEMQAIKLDVLGGDSAAAAWNDALNALHSYAQRSACPPGHDVIRWFAERRDAYAHAINDAINARAKK